MAAVTQTANTAKYNVSGSMRDQYYEISGTNGDYLDVGMTSVKFFAFEPTSSGITGYTVASLGNGQSRITLASGGAFANVQANVRGN